MTEYDTKWKLSPVVGEISDLQAVVVCEPANTADELVCNIKYLSNENPIDKQYNYAQLTDVNHFGPTRVVLKFPTDGDYLLQWLSNTNIIFQHRITVSDEPSKFIFVSCDLLEAAPSFKHSMWTHMEQEIAVGKKICLFHMGDQAYMDKVFKDSLKYVRKHGQNEHTANHIIKLFGERYANTWTPHCNILARVSNYNLWDDHEIINNILLSDENMSADEKYVSDLAVQSYSLYQESQHLIIDTIMTKHSWYKRMGINDEILILAVERTSRIISVDEIMDTIDILTYNVYTTKLVLCFASAPIPPPHGRYGAVYRQIVGDKGTTNTSKFWPSDELAKLYMGLFKWAEYNNQAEILVVGGDLHFGTHGVVRRNGREINVVIASPITNQPTIDRWLASKGMPGTHCIYDGSTNNTPSILFNTIKSKARRCYASVDLETEPMKIDMHWCKKKYPKHSIKYIKTLLSFR